MQKLLIDVLNEVVVAHPRYWPGFYNLGLALKDLGKIDSAIDAFKKVMNLNPAIHKAAWNLALYNLKGDFARVLDIMKRDFILDEQTFPTLTLPIVGWGTGDFREKIF